MTNDVTLGAVHTHTHTHWVYVKQPYFVMLKNK